MVTVQDLGRFGFCKYGIPQSGAMDRNSMRAANRLVGNDESHPVIEYALMGMQLEALENTVVGIAGATMKVNGQPIQSGSVVLEKGDMLELSPPEKVYAYLAIGGLIKAQNDFGSYSTYLMGRFGGIEGRALKTNDVIDTEGGLGLVEPVSKTPVHAQFSPVEIRFIKGPEADHLKDSLDQTTFTVDPSSNRMGIRLNGQALGCSISEIASSAVIPGTIQLPANGQPIILMNDCQTTGGYPRIGVVPIEDLGKLSQVRPGQSVVLYEVTE